MTPAPNSINELLNAAAKWLEASSNPQNADTRLIIERVGFVKEGESLTQVRFQLKAEVFMGQISIPVAGVVLPPPAPVLVAPDGTPATPS